MESSLYAADPFDSSRKKGTLHRFMSAALATAVFRCWPLLVFFSGWATAITIINHNVHSLIIQPTLLTV